MPRSGIVPHIQIPEDQALSALLRVKPTADMPRSGAHAMGPKKKRTGKAKKKRS